MASLTAMWSLLREVRALRFDARSEAATGWNGIGLGTVVVSEPMVGMIVFAEAGTWQSAGRTEFSFNNVFRWSAVGEVLRLEHLRLEHLRFGPDNPVLLFDMAPGEDGVWREVSPHQCRDDCYTASLGVEGRQLLVEWSIRGPRKRESIRYT